jgi:hypothetical protein
MDITKTDIDVTVCEDVRWSKLAQYSLVVNSQITTKYFDQ